MLVWFCRIVWGCCTLGKQGSKIMKETLKYLAGIAGPSGYGSKTTAQQVAQDSLSSYHHLPNNSPPLTAIITG